MDNFVGFEKESQFIINSFKNKTLSNSIIFSGQKGIGKNTFAINLLKEFYKLSTNNNKIDHNLNLLNNLSHPNLKYISKVYDEKLNKFKSIISIDQIRKLHNFFYESTFDGFAKFIIIDSADDLNINAANALLKMLEEPKENTYIFLISHQLSTLLPTMRSRCLKFKFNNHNFENFKMILNDKVNYDDEYVKFLFDLSNGSPGLAIYLDHDDIINLFQKILDSLIENDFSNNNNFELSNELFKYDNDKFKIFLYILKFILLNFKKINSGINISDIYLSSKINLLLDYSSNISESSIDIKLEYLNKNENDLFEYNLDKKYFILNFFTDSWS